LTELNQDSPTVAGGAAGSGMPSYGFTRRTIMRRPLRRQRHRPKLSSRWLLAGASGLALGTTLLNVGQWFQAQAAASQDLCQEVKQSTATLSREQLAKLLAIAERSNRQEVKKVVSEPYCILPALEVRAGVQADREAYPLAFDPKTWLVMLYEGEEYVGYGFSFQ
jgi:hypothetical protein